jgi:metallophosphoesterase (TIGR03767 family)
VDDGAERLRVGTPVTLLGDRTGPGGYRTLVTAPGEPRVLRRELGGVDPGAKVDPVLSFVHLSDLHVTDAQSPARVEFFDRLSDPGSPWLETLGLVETYRPQESLSCQVVEAMVRSVRDGAGPVSRRDHDFAIATGDVTENAQRNELDNCLALLDGGLVRPDSGDCHVWEGVGGDWGPYDSSYWHPDGAPRGERPDRPTELFGFPTVPGLLDACRLPWQARGLGIPWYAVYGNHDALLCGTLPPTALLQHVAQGGQKLVGRGEDADLALLTGHDNCPPDVLRAVGAGQWAPVTPDSARRLVGREEWITAHLESSGGPRGHGLSQDVIGRTGIYYGFDAGPFRCLVLDTNNPSGGWQGSLDQPQVEWLVGELEAAAGVPVLLFSHHPLESLTNDYGPDEVRRTTADGLLRILAEHPNVIAWFAGHTHCNTIRPVVAPGAGTGFWQVTTGSHIDWPQQARAVELLLDSTNRQLVIATTPLDHAGPAVPARDRLADPVDLAAWSRELTFNDWQKRAPGAWLPHHGSPQDRCTALVVPLEARSLRGVFHA